ncbi:cadherin-like domain-containing protein, partial [Psychromonas sp. SP041]|uniref:Ig-like domain-containing protein n=1 Tax=Psychromonas sp. SP041 TaxID=1365007 RepID=UPI001485C37C
MAEQNNSVNESNETKVELTKEQLNLAKEELDQSKEALNSVEQPLPQEAEVGELKVEVEKPNASTPSELNETNTEIDVNDLDAILALGEEVFDLDIETVAGEESGGGFTLVDFDRDGQETIATTNFQTVGFNDDFTPTIFTDEGENLDTASVNSVPTLTIISSNNFTEDDGSAIEGAVVSTFETTDEDGDEVTVTLSDTINYEIVGNTVVLTDAGAALVNSGEDLPVYTLTVNDGTADGESVSDDPSVTTVNDTPTITITSSNDFTEDDGSAVEGAVVSTFETTDEDGDEVTVTLSDTINYEIVGNTVVLTDAGAALVNSGEDLPVYTLTVNDGTADGESVSDDPSVTTVNDTPMITITSSNDFTEDDGSAVEGAVVSTFETTDEDGDEVTVTLSDTINYEIVGNTVVLTEAGAALVNSGEELPAYTLTANDGTADGETISDDPIVTTVDDPTIVTSDATTTNEDTPVTIDVLANDTDADGVVSPVASVTDGNNGTVTINDDGTVTYTPDADFNGSDTFTYTNEDGTTETVSVTVEAVADDTVVGADLATTNEDTPVTIDVLAN